MAASTTDDRPLPENFVRAWRRRLGWSQEDLAARADLSVSTISGIELRTQDFTGKSLLQIAQALETTPGALLSFPPEQHDSDIWKIWDDLGRQDRRQQAAAVLRALRDSGGR